MEKLSRREFIGSSAACAAWVALGRPSFREDAYAPFKMGIQSYSLRAFASEDAMQKTASLGLKYWEAYQDHVPMSNDEAALQPIRGKLKKNGITLWCWGVQGFDGDAAKCRKYFEFAKAMGIKIISADPAPDSFDHLEKLVKEFNIAIAIHNHGPGARYDKLESVLNAVKNRDKRIGACVDTGHTLRSGEDPVEWVKQLGERVHDIHLKDVKNRTEWKVLGQGDLRVVPLFKELRRLKFRNVVNLEYEENAGSPMDDLKACLQTAQQAIRESA